MNSANASSGGAKSKKNRKKENKNPGGGQAVADGSVVKGNTSAEESLDSKPAQNGGATACNSSNTSVVKDMASDNSAGKSDNVIKVMQTSACAVAKPQETFAAFIPEMKVAPAQYQCSAFDMPSNVSLSVAKSQTNCINTSSKIQSNDSSNVSSVSNSKTDIVHKVNETNNVSKQNVDKPEDLVKGMKDLSVKSEQSSEKNIKSNSKASDISHGPAVTVASDSSEAPQKSKAELSRERRALQEAQRAAKAARLAEGGGANQKKDKDNAQQAAPKPPQKQEKKPPKVADTPAKQTVPSDKSAPEKKAEKEKKPQDNLAAQQSRDQKVRTAPHLQLDDHRTVKRLTKKLEKQNLPNRRTAETLRKMGLFRHLPQYERNVPLTELLKLNTSNLHPAIIKLGLQYADGVICGSNARCVALLHALKKVIADYTTPPNTELCRDLEANLSPAISFLQQCRPLSVSMGNAIRHIKRLITTTPTSCSDHEAKQNLCLEIDEFLKNKIKLAAVAISGSAITKINDGDVILVYACSSLIKTVLCTAYDAKKKFSVIVVDSRPKEEGREMMRRLVRHGIPCSYVLINDVSNVMRQVSQVFLGAHALLANGYMMSRVGSSQVALVASAFNVPVIVCCETYKFSEKVWTDSFVANELGDPSDLVRTTDGRMGALRDWVSVPKLNLLNLVYDITPPQLINMVITDITEFGLVPCTSVPVVLRVKNTEIS